MAYNPFSQNAKCVNASQYSTLAVADSAASALGYGLNIDSNFTITSNTELASSPVYFNGGTITLGNNNLTISGFVSGYPYKSFDLNGSGIADLTAAAGHAYIEWWGVINGDTSFNSGNATINKPLIDSALRYGPMALLFSIPGIYSTTGHLLDGNYPHIITGMGKSVAPGATTIINGIIGSGLPCTDAAHMGTDVSATAKYVFQSGLNSTANQTTFKSISIAGSDPTSVGKVIPLGLLGSTLVQNNWRINAEDCAFVGYAALHETWANDNSFSDNYYYGNVYGIIHSIPATASFIIVQKQTFYGGEVSQSQNTSGYALYQNNALNDASISSILWDGTAFEFGFNLAQLAASQQQFNSVHFERFANSPIISEGASYASCWIMPTAAGGNSGTQLVTGLSTRSVVISDGPSVALGGGATPSIIGAGSAFPQGNISASPGSIYLHRGAAAYDFLYGKISGSGSNGWISNINHSYNANNVATGTATFTVGVDLPLQKFLTTLTGNTTVTFSTTNAVTGDWFRIIAPPSLGGHTFTVNGTSLTAIQWYEGTYDGSSWQQTAAGSLI